MDLKKFKGELLEIYNSYEPLFSYINNESYLKFLYCHMNEIEVIISSEKLKGDFLMCNKLKVNTNYSHNINLIYRKYLSEADKNIINDMEFYVYVSKTEYPKIKEDAVEADKYFMLKNRRDFLLPSFFHKLTIETLSNFKIKDYKGIEKYVDQKKRFFKLLAYIRKYIKTKERLGVMLDTFNIMDIRENNHLTLSMVLEHPRNYDPNIRKNRIIFEHLVGKLIIMVWSPTLLEKKDKKRVVEQTKKETGGKITNYLDIVFGPENHFYFFGLKIYTIYHKE